MISSLRRCAFFAVGRCKKAEECSYSHQDGPPMVTLVKPRPQQVYVPPRVHVPPAAWPEAEHAEQVDLGSSSDPSIRFQCPGAPPNGFPWKTRPLAMSKPLRCPFLDRLCKFFQMGHCNRVGLWLNATSLLQGASCGYAHGPDELSGKEFMWQLTLSSFAR